MDTLNDIDGNIYKTVKIGNQIWMAENLCVGHFRTGDPIPEIESKKKWVKACDETSPSFLFSLSYTGPACCYYENDPVIGKVYGRLYNWYAVSDIRGLGPEGWHVPTDQEWKELEKYLGMSQREADKTNLRGTDEGGKLKETGTTHWKSPNTGATNESGFSALPGGYRDNLGDFDDLGISAFFWSTFKSISFYRFYRGLGYNTSGISSQDPYSSVVGFSVRLVKD